MSGIPNFLRGLVGGGSVPATPPAIPADIPWTNVVSSNVAALMYDAKKSQLWVRFLGKNGKAGSIYVYYHVPKDVAESFLRAGSQGKFVWQALRGRFAYHKIA